MDKWKIYINDEDAWKKYMKSNCTQASAGNGETAKGEDDPLCNAAKGRNFFVLRISL